MRTETTFVTSTSAEASARSRPPTLSTRQPAVTYGSVGRLRGQPARPDADFTRDTAIAGRHPQQDPMRHAERARLSHRPAVCSTPTGHGVIIALKRPVLSSPAAVAPSVAATWAWGT